MACLLKLVTMDGRELKLGKFNEGKKTDTQIALAAARKYKNLIGRLECGGYKIIVQRGAGHIEVPVDTFRNMKL